MKRVIHRGTFALATLAALGFGAAQAFASPGETAARACNGGQCNRDCKARGADGGFCDQGGCICYIQVTPES